MRRAFCAIKRLRVEVCSALAGHAVFPGQIDGVVLRSRQSSGRHSMGREVAVRNVFGPLVAADMVAHCAQAQIHRHTVPRREVAGGRMNQAAVKQNHGARWALRARRCRRGRNDRRRRSRRGRPARSTKPERDEFIVHRPQRDSWWCDKSCLRGDHTACLMAAGDEHQRDRCARFTSSRKIATFIARSVGIMSSLSQVP